MSTVQLRYIGGLEYVDVPVLRREGEPFEDHGQGCLVRGEVFTCDKSVAGRAPTYDDDGNVTDYGEGLLAQPSNFELAGNEPSPVKKKASKKARPRKTATSKPDPSPPMPPASPTDETTEA